MHDTPPTTGTKREGRGLEGTGGGGASAGEKGNAVGEGEAGEKDQTGHRTGRSHVGHRHQNDRHRGGGELDGGYGRSGAGGQPVEAPRQRAVAGHLPGEPRGRQKVGLQRGQHRQQTGDDHQPIAGGAEKAPCRNRDQDLGVCRGCIADRLAGRAHRHDQEQQWDVDHERGGQRQDHRARDVALGPFHLAPDRGDQIEALERDEGVAHGLDQALAAVRHEGAESCAELLDPRRVNQEHPETAGDDDREDDDLADGFQLPAAGVRSHELPGVEGDRRQRVHEHRKTGVEPSRWGAAGRQDHLFEDRHEKDRKSEGVQDGRHHRGEPHHPPDGEGSLYRQHLARVGVGAAGLGEPGRERGERQRREHRDGAVQRKGDDRARPGGGKGNAGEGQHAAADDRADADAGGGEEPHGPLTGCAVLWHASL